jgi:hypothetical protein
VLQAAHAFAGCAIPSYRRRGLRISGRIDRRLSLPLVSAIPIHAKTPTLVSNALVHAGSSRRAENVKEDVLSMAVDVRLVEEIEALTRTDFRASVNAERRATLAIGALVLAWGQLDSALGWMISELRKRHEALGLGGRRDEHPFNQSDQLSLLRKFIKECSDGHLRDFDRLRERISRSTVIRDDLVHGALGLGNSLGTPDGVEIVCVPSQKSRKTENGFIGARHEIVLHQINEIFLAADHLRDDRCALEELVSCALEDIPP